MTQTTAERIDRAVRGVGAIHAAEQLRPDEFEVRGEDGFLRRNAQQLAALVSRLPHERQHKLNARHVRIGRVRKPVALHPAADQRMRR